jgi:hypothetical protein
LHRTKQAVATAIKHDPDLKRRVGAFSSDGGSREETASKQKNVKREQIFGAASIS